MRQKECPTKDYQELALLASWRLDAAEQERVAQVLEELGVTREDWEITVAPDREEHYWVKPYVWQVVQLVAERDSKYLRSAKAIVVRSDAAQK